MEARKSLKASLKNPILVRRASVALIGLALLAALILTFNAVLLAIDRPLTNAQVSAREERLNITLFTRLKKVREEQLRRSADSLPAIRDPFASP